MHVLPATSVAVGLIVVAAVGSTVGAVVEIGGGDADARSDGVGAAVVLSGERLDGTCWPLLAEPSSEQPTSTSNNATDASRWITHNSVADEHGGRTAAAATPGEAAVSSRTDPTV